MAIDFSFLENASPKPQEPETVKVSGLANISIRVDADCIMQCDGEFVDIPLKAGMMVKTALPVGQHLVEFISQENPNIKIEKVVEWPESDKNYLVIVNELKAKLAPVMPQEQQGQKPVSNPYLDQLGQMVQMNPLGGMTPPQMPPIPNNNKN